MKKVVCFPVVLFYFCVSLWARAGDIPLRKSIDGYTFDFSLPEYSLYTVERTGLRTAESNTGDTYIRMDVPAFNRFTTDEIGRPELPLLQFMMVLSSPDQMLSFELENVIEKKIVLDRPLFPAQAQWPKSRPLSERPFEIDRVYYQSSGRETAVVYVKDVFSIRGVYCATIQLVPFAYNPALKTLTAITKATVNIKTDPGQIHSALDSKVFERMINAITVNYYDVYQPNTLRNQKENYLIVTADKYESQLDEFISFREKRFNVALATTSQTGTNSSSIQSYIKQQYNNSSTKPSFVLLVGSADDLPGFSSSSYTDRPYSSVDGDNYPEMQIGRFPAKDSAELANVIRKTIYMEMNMSTLPLENLFIGGIDEDNGYIAEETHNHVISNYFQPAGYSETKLYFNSDQSITKQDISNTINSGVIFNIYSSHGQPTFWKIEEPHNFYIEDVKELTNTTSYPFCYAFACYTGKYQVDCISANWVCSEHGGVTSWGSSVMTSWTPDDQTERTMIKAMFRDSVTTISASFVAGVLSCSSKESYLKQYNLMGDPAIEAFPIELPEYIEVTAPNGGEEWEQGSMQSITWETNVTGDVKIELLKNGMVSQQIAGSVPGDTPYEWNVPDDLAVGADYTIGISSVTDPDVKDESDETFSIIKSTAITGSTGDNSAGNYIACGPNPVSIHSEGVRFYGDVDEVATVLITVYDALGSCVFTGELPERVRNGVLWDLTGPAGKKVSCGTYLVVIKISTADGSERITTLPLGIKE